VNTSQWTDDMAKKARQLMADLNADDAARGLGVSHYSAGSGPPATTTSVPQQDLAPGHARGLDPPRSYRYGLAENTFLPFRATGAGIVAHTMREGIAFS
jgi:hypothetical protein